MAKEKTVNYTPEMVERMKAMYAEGGNAALQDIADALNRPLRSVRAKLVHEGVYVATGTVPKTRADEGPTKKELLARLDSLEAFSTEGLDSITKDALTRLIRFVEDVMAVEVEVEEVAEEATEEG